MKFPAYNKYDKAIYIALVIPYTALINWLLFGRSYFTQLNLFLVATGIMLIAAIALYYLIILFAIAVRTRMPEYHQAFRRGLILITVAFVITGSFTTILFSGYDYFHFMEYEMKRADFYLALASTLTLNIIGTILNEAADAMEKWKNTVTESEQLKKANLQSQLDGLKEQVNPHFLFNSLNSLSSLISEDPQKANRFLNEMSKVYRYLLRANEESLTTLGNELQFIQSYYHLLKTRYNEGISLDIRVTDDCLNYCIPPLTLQLLTENAVKHNTILKEQPLKIEIVADHSGHLTIKNNLQLKTIKMPSTRIGLSNIVSKYRLLNQPDIVIRENKKEFSVIVPLIKQPHEIVQTT